MADINSFSFTGRLGADAVVKTLPSGKHVMEMSVAINTGYGDYKKTLWAKVKVWGEKVNNIAPIFTKGALVGGSGELGTNVWTGKDGSEHTDIEITCISVNVLSSKKSAGQETPAGQETSAESDYPEDIPY